MRLWGEKILVKSGTLSASINGEYNWTADVAPSGTPIFNTVLGDETHQEAISSFNYAEQLWTVTGDLYFDDDNDGVYDGIGEDLVLNHQYTIWFGATTNNWPCNDDYENSTSESPFPQITGTLMATATPEPATMALLVMGGIATLLRRRCSSK
jgi:hypothetical protein